MLLVTVGLAARVGGSAPASGGRRRCESQRSRRSYEKVYENGGSSCKEDDAVFEDFLFV